MIHRFSQQARILCFGLIGLVIQPLAQAQSSHLVSNDSIAYYRKALTRRYPVAVSAHRGASDIAPENTLATYRESLRMQVDYIEIDVRTTKDGQLAILHDRTLDRTTTGKGPLNEQTLASLKQLSAGKGFGDRYQTERIPTLDEVCTLITSWNAQHKQSTNLYVDCKDVAPLPLVQTLNAHGLLKGAVFYGSDDFLLALKKIAPEARLMPSLRQAQELPEKISKLHPYAFDVSWDAMTESLVRQIHQQGVKVFSDLLDHDDQAEQYRKAANWQVDVIQTDQVLNVYRSLTSK